MTNTLINKGERSPFFYIRNMKTLIIDSNNLFWISKYRIGDKPSSYDLENGIIFHFLDIIFEVAERLKTNKFLFVFDSKKSKRKQMYPEYKAFRRQDMTEKEKENLKIYYEQFNLLQKEILPYMGFKNIFFQEYYEGDDLIASLVLNNKKKFCIVTADEDMYQLLDRCTIHHYKKNKTITKDIFMNTYGIGPKQWIDAKCYAGEAKTNDNIKGVDSIGMGTAIKFIKGELPEFTKAKKPTKAYAAITSEEAKEIYNTNRPIIELPLEGTEICEYIPDEPLTLSNFLDIFNRYNLKYFTTQKELNKIKQVFMLKGLND